MLLALSRRRRTLITEAREQYGSGKKSSSSLDPDSEHCEHVWQLSAGVDSATSFPTLRFSGLALPLSGAPPSFPPPNSSKQTCGHWTWLPCEARFETTLTVYAFPICAANDNCSWCRRVHFRNLHLPPRDPFAV
ncbi:hypothetical protein CFIO01_08187 [Colletotrichum fioriniae PJ7]|uniref:Uncharacterized protein n=1 Tax=Colletotrichum fioriniae PJ7 TaxID=1445577 RepID=A0A010R0L3_9PEZI|nr:hypothetical protein CFIO01_08187 [Colletotrichum fioriniae PJ7]